MNFNSVIQNVLKKIEPSPEESKYIDKSVQNFIGRLKKVISKMEKKPEIFIGGSYAKKTLIRKDKYDIDIFLRFDKEYKNEEISKITGRLLKGFENVYSVHGSREYFRIKIDEKLYIEIVPVLKVSSTKDVKNITDLSYSHVKYINKKIKNDKILEDIKIAKAFCHANNCYGAESYIKGFSGYSLELLIYYYKGFVKMVREFSKNSEEKIVIDIEKDYKNKREILLDLNSSKLESPIILIDPTYPQRNALAALSKETFEKFKIVCKNFLKNPSEEFFETKKINLDKIRKDALNKSHQFILLEVSTNKQDGDIAGSKLLKFYNHICREIERFYEIKNKGFNYNGKKSARYFFVVSNKKEILYNGPSVNDLKNVKRFKKEHKNISEKNGKLYSREKFGLDIKSFIKIWKTRNKKKVKEMSVEELKILEP